jgi:hypothetical protein
MVELCLTAFVISFFRLLSMSCKESELNMSWPSYGDTSNNIIVGSRVVDSAGFEMGIATIVVMTCVYFYLQRKSEMQKKAPLPPGQFGLPFLGETLELQSALQANKPHQFFNTRVAKYGEVIWHHKFLFQFLSTNIK